MRLLLFLVAFACVVPEGDYQKLLSKIPDELRTMFPPDISGTKFNLTFNTSPYLNDFTGEIVSVYVSCQPDQFDALHKKYRKEAIGNYAFADSCNVIPYRFQLGTYRNQKGKEWLYQEWIKEIEQCPSGYYPIPNFVNVGVDEWQLRQGLPPDYEIYVLEAEPGKKFSESYYTEPIIMPAEWLRGYSYGVAVSDLRATIIWWLIIW